MEYEVRLFIETYKEVPRDFYDTILKQALSTMMDNNDNVKGVRVEGIYKKGK